MINEAVFREAFNLLCGKQIGEGIHRKVFECKIRSDLVVKVESEDLRYFANVFEQNFWDEFQWVDDIRKYLAPCEFLSPDGRILLQRKCEPINSKVKLPDKLPAFLTDIKADNFGLLDGRLVCFDYALIINNPSTRMKKFNRLDW